MKDYEGEAMAKSPAFSFYPGDWLGSQRIELLPIEAEGAYHRLLCFCWVDDHCSIPDDDVALARLSKLAEAWPRHSPSIRTFFLPHPTMPNRLHNPRLSKEREKQRLHAIEASKKGKLGAETRWGKGVRKNARGIAQAMPKNSLSSSSSSSSSSSLSSSSAPSTSPTEGVLKKEPLVEQERLFADDAQAVFEHYRRYHPKAFPKARSKLKEYKLIVARLKEGWSVDDLCHAIDGCHRSPFHCGQNEDGRVYQSLELIVRNGSKVSMFLEVPDKASFLSQKTRRGQAAVESFLADHGVTDNGTE